MLSYDEALTRILAAVPGPLPTQTVALDAAQNRVLASDIYASESLPPFDNSAVDGYAVRLADAAQASSTAPVRLLVTQTIAAGYAPTKPVLPGEAARILTGAPVPPGADALVMVEDTATDGDTVLLSDVPSAHFIRRAGSDLPRGALALAAGSILDGAALGLLAALNHTDLPCVRQPRVAVITTGDEIISVGGPSLQPGQIRDANGPALQAVVHEAGAIPALRFHVPDSLEDTRDALRAASECDVIVSCGGVSVGAFDFVKAALEAEGGNVDFWRVAIRPGKPLCFGRIPRKSRSDLAGSALFFGLPGNPASSLVTFELFVRPVLRKLGGYQSVSRSVLSVRLAAPMDHEPGRREFVRARLSFDGPTPNATPTGAQTSHRLASMLNVDALLVADENRGDYAVGETLPALWLRD